MVSGKVFYGTDLYLACFIGSVDGIKKRLCIGIKRKFSDYDFLFIACVKLCTCNDFSVSIVVVAYIYETTRRNIRENGKWFPLETLDFRIDDFKKVVRKDLCAHSDCNTFSSDEKNDRKLCTVNFRLKAASVIVWNVVGDVFVCYKEFLCDGKNAAFNVTPCRCTVASELVAEVSLFVDEDFLVGKVYQSPVNGSITMGMVFHGASDDILNLLEKSVIHFKKSVHDAALNRLKSILKVRNRTVADNIRSVFYEVLVKYILYKSHNFSLKGSPP